MRAIFNFENFCSGLHCILLEQANDYDPDCIDFSIKSDCSFEMEIFRNFDEHWKIIRCRWIWISFNYKFLFKLKLLSFKLFYIHIQNTKEKNWEIWKFSMNFLHSVPKIILNFSKVYEVWNIYFIRLKVNDFNDCTRSYNVSITKFIPCLFNFGTWKYQKRYEGWALI